MPHRLVARLLAALALAGCATLPALHRDVPIDPEATFTAHPEHKTLVLDRLPGGGRGTAVPPGWFHGLRQADVVLVSEGETRAAFWLTAPARVEIHAETARGSASLGEVVPDWDDGAIRLTLRTPEGEAFTTDRFERVNVGSASSTLSRNAQTVLDTRGTYRAAIRDAKGGTAGWMRVRVSPYAEASRIFDADLPKPVGPALATAGALALDSEITWIEDHTLDVYRGKSGGGLEQSIPIGGGH
jgi:hypothetical protein